MNPNLGMNGLPGKTTLSRVVAHWLEVGSLIPGRSPQMSGISGDYPRSAGDLVGDQSPDSRGLLGDLVL